MSLPDARHLRRQLITVTLARSDFKSADLLAETIIQRGDAIGDFAGGVYTAVAVSYARPFTESRGYGQISAKWQRFPDRPELLLLHDRVIEDRHTLLAHNDLTPHRGVRVFTRGLFGPTASATTERDTLNLAGVEQLRGLFAYQSERLGEHEAELLELLRVAEGWPDGIELSITLEGSGTDSVPADEPPDEENPA